MAKWTTQGTFEVLDVRENNDKFIIICKAVCDNSRVRFVVDMSEVNFKLENCERNINDYDSDFMQLSNLVACVPYLVKGDNIFCKYSRKWRDSICSEELVSLNF